MISNIHLHFMFAVTFFFIVDTSKGVRSHVQNFVKPPTMNYSSGAYSEKERNVLNIQEKSSKNKNAKENKEKRPSDVNCG